MRCLQSVCRALFLSWSLLLLDAPKTSADASYLDSLLQQAHAKRLADRREWRLLLHDHIDLLGIYHSDIDDRKFFLAKHGRHDPSAELDATLQAFFEPV